MVISMDALFSEIDDAFEFIGDLKDRLVVSNAACLIQPYHQKIDQLKSRIRINRKRQVLKEQDVKQCLEERENTPH